MADTTQDNLTAVLHGKCDLRMENVPIPAPKDGEVLVSISKCGICRTDIHLWQQGGCDDFQPTDPIVIGHECSGRVVKVGPKVKQLKIGDRVAIELGLPCRLCDHCRTGHYNLCKPFSLGGLTRYHAWAEDFCHKLPEHVSDEEGALMEPLAVAVRAGRRGGVKLGDHVLVGGAGPIGLSCLLAAKSMGASQVCLTDISQSRLRLATKMGADHVIQVQKGQTPRDLAVEVVKVMGVQPNVTLETSGAQASLQTAIHATRAGGTLVPVGLDPAQVTLPLTISAVKEVDIKGSFSYGPSDYPTAVAMVSSGRVDPTPMITHRFELTDTLQACELGKVASDDVIKIMINCQK